MDTEPQQIIPPEESGAQSMSLSLKVFEIIVLIVVIVGGVLWYVSYNKTADTVADNFFENHIILDKALYERSPKECDNIINAPDLHKSCKEQVREYLISDTAIQKQDPSECADIQDEDLKNYCLNIAEALSTSEKGILEILETTPDTE
jgi:hypothetical protein